jgi:hypothetical protein
VNAAALTTARRLGPVTVLSSVQHEGLWPRSPAAQLRHLADRLRDGPIVDLHDAPGLPGAPERLLATMPGLLDVVKARGYAAIPVGESPRLPSGARRVPSPADSDGVRPG